MKLRPYALVLLLACTPATLPAPESTSNSTSTASPSSALPTEPPNRIGVPIAVGVFGEEYELGAGRSELVLDADGWVAQRGYTDKHGVSTDDQPVLRIVDGEARSLTGARLARVDASGRIQPIAFPENALSTSLRIDADGYLVAHHGQRIDTVMTVEGDRNRRKDLALAEAVLSLLPVFAATP
jgi:hypothetical protein